MWRYKHVCKADPKSRFTSYSCACLIKDSEGRRKVFVGPESVINESNDG